jgi:hypothetical protein
MRYTELMNYRQWTRKGPLEPGEPVQGPKPPGR